MKAFVCNKYGPPEVLKVKEMPKPVPKDNEVCIKNFATAVTGSDVLIRGADMPFFIRLMFQVMIGFKKPRKPIPGLVFAGEIESVGKAVKRFNKGDQVYGFTGYSFGAYAEYICISEEDSKLGCIEIKHPGMSYEEAAAAVYAGVLAPYFLEKGNIQKGQKVLVYGASGAIGTASVQLAKNLGAEVTGICSTRNIELVKSLGADQVIDYTKEDVANSKERYDFILDAVPYGKIDRKKLKAQCKNALSPNGKHVSIDDGSPKLKAEYLEQLNSLFETGKFKVVIDRKYPLEQIVEAHRYVDTGRKKGNVVITVQHDKT
ncbi:NAD(P)-dependent alcohol dehydrogenase [Saccharicrinis sp. 156]|uniref:NAD(P)-dependent alcohol dehydrogenase n=1 Tax=Saccharicrinis sp. 156 TaxID=3417574 RepID=UPI003D34464A